MSWPVVRLGDIFEKEVGGISFSRDQFSESGIPVVPKKAISSDVQIDNSNLVYTPPNIAEKYAQYSVDSSFLITTLRDLVPTGPNLGRICEINAPHDFLLAQGVYAFKLCGKVHPKYLCYFSNSNSFRKQVLQAKVGSTQVHIRSSEFKAVEIPLPPLTEQKRIAAILDKADAIRRKRQQAIQLADEFLRAVFLDMFGDPVTNPNGWEVKKMREVIEFRGGHQPPKETFEYEDQEGFVRLVQIRDFKSDRFKTYIPEKLAKRRFQEDDVMIARYGPPVFQILRGLSGSYNVALMKAVPKGKITKDFIFRLLQLPAYHDTVVANSERTAGQTGVNLDLLNNFDVPLPPIDVQAEIIRKVKKAEDSLLKMNEKAGVSLELFKSLSQRAFSGQL